MLDIFISYSQEDFSGGSRHIKNYISRHIQDSDVFLDQSKTKGTKWRNEIEEALASSDIFIVVLTHGALESKEVAKEIDLARRDKERFVIPCKDNLLEIDWDDIPWNLSEYDGITFDDIEELGRKLVTEIKKIEKELKRGDTGSGDNVESIIMSGDIHLSYHGNQAYSLNYEIKNGEVLSSIPDREAASIIVSIASFNAGELRLKLPRNIIDAKIKDDDDSFFVLIDGMESKHEEIKDNFTRKLIIPFEKGANQITIIGTQLFGVSYSGISKEENTVKFLLGGGVIKNDARYLEPQTLRTKSGEKVKWVNADRVGHTITSGKVSDDTAGSIFDSGLIRSGASFEIVFNKKGTYHYFDTVHPWIVGQIVVE